MPETDEAQESNVDATSTASESTEKTSEMEKSESQDSEQSKESEASTYRLPHIDRDLTQEEVIEEAIKVSKSSTEVLQENKQLKSKVAEIEKAFSVGAKTEETTRSSEMIKQLTPDEREAIIGLVMPEVRKEFVAREKSRDQQNEWDSAFKGLAQEWDGSDGKPKYDSSEKDKILDEMRKSNARIFDPQIIWEQKHKEEIRDWDRNMALKQKGGGIVTDQTSTKGGDKKPKTKPAKSLQEATRNFLSRTSGGSSFED